MAEMIGEDLTVKRHQIERHSALGRKIQITGLVTWLWVMKFPAQTEKYAAELADFLHAKPRPTNLP